MRTVITGVPGVGKTSVMDGVAKKKSLNTVNYGTVMFEVAKAKGLAENRDQMRKLPVQSQKDIQEKAAEKIYEMGEIIINTHCTIKTPAGYYPGLPERVLRKLRPDRIIIVEATIEEITKRRSKDKSRTRDADSEAEIEEHQMMNRYAAMAYATLSRASVKIVFNHDNGLDAAVEEIMKIF